ncbi:Protein kinase domain [Castilleja foliolosa]|uniref:Protein kinase domain n=1 Tax=Castilleja foliolosa TaxID=1961234 RepID=A0ABD3BQG8_9LAMI
MDRRSMATILYSGLLCLILVFARLSMVSANGEG